MTAVSAALSTAIMAFSPAAQAYTVVPVYGADGSLWANLIVSDTSDNVVDNTLFPGQSLRNGVTDLEMTAIRDAVLYMSDMLGNPVSVPDITVFPVDQLLDNAAAESDVADESGNTWLAACIQGKGECRAGNATGRPGTRIVLWRLSDLSRPVTGSLSPLAGLEWGFNMSVVLIHELWHALGLGAETVAGTEDGTFVVKADPASSLYSRHLVDVYGTTLATGMPIRTTPDDLEASYETEVTAPDANSFCTSIGTKSGVKFVGENVTEVIGSDTVIYYPDVTIVEKKTAVSEGGETSETWELVTATRLNSVVGGIPVNGQELDLSRVMKPELSHLELQNSVMSHQGWRNWATPMEAELAVLQDIGYEFDRKRYFGTSVYASGTSETITQAFTARENYAWTDAPSTQSYAVGVHVYGSLNSISVEADQLADGAESFGIRVDGVMNTVTVQTGVTVSADGTNGTGIAFTYGNGHTLTIAEDATVSAAGTGGKALAFDFGGNALGATTEYRGSFIQSYYTQDSETGTYSWKNSGEDPTTTALTGALMEEVNISGKISAPSGKAIYISPNALVSVINVLDGAEITGDIVSEWNALSTLTWNETEQKYLLSAQVNLGDGYDIRARTWCTSETEVPDLTTEMVFGSDEDTANEFLFSYTGTISGASGLRLTFGSGTSVMSGSFSVLGAVVKAGATVAGESTWTLTAKDETTYARVSDDSGFVQGALVNSGSLWSTAATGLVTISGNYIQKDSGTILTGVKTDGSLSGLTVTGEMLLPSSTAGSAGSADSGISTASAASQFNVSLIPDAGYWADGATVSPAANAVVATDGAGATKLALGDSVNASWNTAVFETVSKTLTMTENGDGSVTLARKAGAYTALLASAREDLADGTTSAATAAAASAALSSATVASIASLLDANAGTATGANAQALIASLDFAQDTGRAAAQLGELTGDAHMSAVRAQFAVERLVDRTLARRPADAAVTGRHVWAQPFGGRLADNTAGAHSRTKAAGLAGGVTLASAGQEIGWQMAAAYFSESNNLKAKTRGQGLWLGGSLASSIDPADTWWFDLSGRLGLANVKTERVQTAIGSSQEAEGTRISATLAGKVGPRLELADVLSVRPAVGLTGTVLRTPSKTEDKVGGLEIDDAWYRSLRAQIGVSAETAPISSAVTGFSWKWTANAGYERELLQDAGEFKAGIAGMTGSFSQRVDWNDRNRWIVGGGLELANEQGFTAALRVETELTHGDGAAVTGGAELRWRF
ncbi:MAG: autotransporter outer membrane beta-barrel domain-containing protein [Sutterella sp.]|nr:autotransporter outer membrane beta-barrel domain-containing protein [Sutterella sp.]